MSEQPGPLRRDAERNRARILAAARQLFADTGLTVTHHEVARAADLGVGTVYRRFPTREDLMRALFEDQLEKVGRLADAALDDEDAERGLRGFLTGVTALQAADRGLQEHMLGPGAAARAGAATDRIAPVVARLLTRAQAAGQVRADVTVQDVALLPVMVGAVTERARGVDPELWRRVLALVLDGLRPGTGPLPGRSLDSAQFGRVMASGRPR